VTLRTAASGNLWARAPIGGMEQILDNLLANAIAAAPPGSQVTVSASSVGRDVELRVNDQGPGLAPDQRAQAFERFWRGDSSSPGTGLGLPIVRQLARLAGGDARLEVGDGGRGLAAVVVLPRVPKSAAEAATTKEPLTLR
jgi:signal transduction histidine kinase